MSPSATEIRSTTEAVAYRRHDNGVAHIELNKPDSLNSLDLDVLTALVDLGRQIGEPESGVRAVVLSGRGRAFCSGLDRAQFEKMTSSGAETGGEVERLGAAKSVAQQAVHIWSIIPQPVIAAVHGYALGGGLQLTLGADIRVMEPTAKLSVMEVAWGLIPDMTGTQLLPELVGRDVAKDLTFTGRMITGEDAATMGLATRLSDDAVTEALDLAGQIATHTPMVLSHAKRLLELAGRVDLATGLDAEQEALHELLTSPEQIALISARLANG